MAALWRARPALLPVRFGTFARDLADLESMVRHRESLARLRLRAVRNRAQMTVRIVEARIADPQSRTPNRQSSIPVPDLRSPARGRSYLRSRQRALEIPESLALRAAVRRWVREERVERGGRVVSLYHLIPRAAAEPYRSALDRAARAAGVKVVVSGPWPPYAFTGI
jgi:hypothetical protein